MREYGSYNNNAFIRMDVIHTETEIAQLKTRDFLYTNQTINFSDFIDKLVQYEATHNPAKKKNLQIRYGVVFTLLLDKKRDFEDVKKLCDAFIKRYNNLPFFSFVFKEGKGNYIGIYVSERHFYKKAKKEKIIATCDRYKDALTGKICKSDSPNAVKIWEKNKTILGEKETVFSKKETFFKYPSVNAFKKVFMELKRFWISILKKICKAEIEFGISFNRFVKRNRTISEIRVANAWNKTFSKMESYFNNALYALEVCECYDKANLKKMTDIFKKYEEAIKNKRMPLKHGFYIPILNDKKYNYYLKNNTEALLEMFKDDVNKKMRKMIPICY